MNSSFFLADNMTISLSTQYATWQILLTIDLLRPLGIFSWRGKGCSNSWRAWKVQRWAHECEIHHQWRCSSSFLTLRWRAYSGLFLSIWSLVIALGVEPMWGQTESRRGKEDRSARNRGSGHYRHAIWFLVSGPDTFWLLMFQTWQYQRRWDGRVKLHALRNWRWSTCHSEKCCFKSVAQYSDLGTIWFAHRPVARAKERRILK